MSNDDGKPRSFTTEMKRGTRMVRRDGRHSTPRATLIEGAPIVDLSAERMRRVEGAGQAAHERGEAFALLHYTFDDSKIGYDTEEGADRSTEVIVITDGHLSGLAMSARDAMRLGEALIEAGKRAPSMNPKPVGPESA